MTNEYDAQGDVYSFEHRLRTALSEAIMQVRDKTILGGQAGKNKHKKRP